MLVSGIDSSTHLGISLVGNGQIKGKKIEVAQVGFPRLQSIAAEVERTLKIWQPDFAVVERYAFCRNIDSFICLVEVGTLVKQVLYNLHIPWAEVSPTMLKKWVTGNGHADKEEMARFVESRWGYKSADNDIVDSVALAKIGEELGMEGISKMLVKKKKKTRKTKCQ